MRAVLYKVYNNIWAPPLEARLKYLGYSVRAIQAPKTWQNAHAAYKILVSADVVFIWHGSEPGDGWATQVCREAGVPVFYVEHGLLPQKGHWQIDTGGIVGRSSLCGDLSWVTTEMAGLAEAHMRKHMAEYGYTHEGGDYVLVPFQLEHDAAVFMSGPAGFGIPRIRTMQQLVDAVRVLRPGARIMVSRHPKDRNRKPPEGVEVSRRSTMEAVRNASEVVGLTSTVLYEAAATGCPVTALGYCPMSVHSTPEARSRLLAAAVTQQIPALTEDITPWLRRLGVPMPA